MINTGATAKARAKAERELREALDRGIPCSLINFNDLVIDGYDDSGFFCAQPRTPRNRLPPAKAFHEPTGMKALPAVSFPSKEAQDAESREARILVGADRHPKDIGTASP